MTKGNNAPLKIFLADDDPDDRLLFQEALAEVYPKTTVTFFSTGDKLLKHLSVARAEQPDIIFLDIHMPVWNGKMCLKAIRSRKEFDHVPVVMFSTSSHPEDIEETFENRANLYVSKPAYFTEEVEVLKNIFNLNWQEEMQNRDMRRFIFLLAELNSFSENSQRTV